MNGKRSTMVWACLISVFAGLAACSTPGSEASQASGSDGCTPKHDFETIEPGVLTVAHFANPPFADTEGDKLVGAEGEILSRIAEMECLEIKVNRGNVPAMIPAVQSGRADTTLGSWYRTAERAEIVLLSDPVLTVYLAIASPTGSGIEQVDDIVGRTVGSTIGSLWVDDVDNLVGDDQKLYDNIEAQYSDLEAGRIDAVLNSEPTAVHQLQVMGLEDEFEVNIPDPHDAVAATELPGQTNFPVNKSNPELLEAINDGLAELRESGEFDEILAEYGLSPESNKAEPLTDF